MTEKVRCPACGDDVPVEIENLEGDPIDVDCKCGASLKVEYEVTEIDKEVTVEKAPSVSFECPKCGGYYEIDDPEEEGSDEFACEYCPATFQADWSDWGQSVNYTEV